MKNPKNKGKEDAGKGINPGFVLTVEIFNLKEKLRRTLAKFYSASRNLPKETTMFYKTIVTIHKCIGTLSKSSVKHYKMSVSDSRTTGAKYRTCFTITRRTATNSKISGTCYKTTITFYTTNVMCDEASANSYRLALEVIRILELLELNDKLLSALGNS